MNYFPLFFDLKDKSCLVVGGGDIAFRKCELLKSSGVSIEIVAIEVSPALKLLLASEHHHISERKFVPSDLESKALVICATGDSVLNKEISLLAQGKNIPINVVDSAALSSVIFPSIIDRSPIIVAASTGASSPVLASQLREQLEAMLPQNLASLASFLGMMRTQIKATFPKLIDRRRAVESFLLSPGETLAREGNFEKAKAYLVDAKNKEGEVYLVGAGPGDPDLLTIKALHLMQKADIVLYDNLISKEILQRVRRDAEKLFVGKAAKVDSIAQEDINQLLVKHAKLGKRVLRLKGGDPFIFGRGGEELETLAAENINFQIVPGITAASGCSTYAGIPLTHRDYSQSVRFVTGHPKNGAVDLPWSEFVHKNQTIVFYMGLGGLDSICKRLILHGRENTTPVAVISKGTTPEQRTVIGDLSSITELVKKAALARPTLIIVGEVVSLHETLNPNNKR
ncbi:MAG: uroporphyrin-III C-methyltransferase/precorrin-2 dehydrogenase/sirohydrochlorin ferrochelatase [Candidatus Azotimanducaceae bacterium]|jgi:uroporphyrin-III C-methyltransferase/precorrin-2 dehydrogenase/sirohydrochlorin ferrochelatase